MVPCPIELLRPRRAQARTVRDRVVLKVQHLARSVRPPARHGAAAITLGEWRNDRLEIPLVRPKEFHAIKQPREGMFLGVLRYFLVADTRRLASIEPGTRDDDHSRLVALCVA
jgi:hypothetical protein